MEINFHAPGWASVRFESVRTPNMQFAWYKNKTAIPIMVW